MQTSMSLKYEPSLEPLHIMLGGPALEALLEGGAVSVKDTASSAGGGCMVPLPSEETTTRKVS